MSGGNFSVQLLPPSLQQEMREKKTWTKDCPVSIERFRLLTFSYYNFEGNEHHDGELIVLEAIALRVATIFKHLHELKFPIAKALRIEHYNGNDEASMADNNTSCFNSREITGGGLPSLHSYGLAIDVNPIQNPFMQIKESESVYKDSLTIMPAAGKDYLNRTNLRAGMAETIVEVFKENGLRIWGGKWNTPIDWQHFQVPRALAKLLAVMSPEDAEVLFETYVKSPNLLNFDDSNDERLIASYKEDPKRFMDSLF